MAAERGFSAGGGIDDEHVVDDEFLPVVIRKAPRYGRLLGFGVFGGLIVAAILTFASSTGAGPGDPFDSGASALLRVFGIYAAVCIACGLLLMGTFGLILDRLASTHARHARAEHVTTLVVDLEAPVDDTVPRWARDADDLA